MLEGVAHRMLLIDPIVRTVCALSGRFVCQGLTDSAAGVVPVV